MNGSKNDSYKKILTFIKLNETENIEGKQNKPFRTILLKVERKQTACLCFSLLSC